MHCRAFTHFATLVPKSLLPRSTPPKPKPPPPTRRFFRFAAPTHRVPPIFGVRTSPTSRLDGVLQDRRQFSGKVIRKYQDDWPCEHRSPRACRELRFVLDRCDGSARGENGHRNSSLFPYAPRRKGLQRVFLPNCPSVPGLVLRKRGNIQLLGIFFVLAGGRRRDAFNRTPPRKPLPFRPRGPLLHLSSGCES